MLFTFFKVKFINQVDFNVGTVLEQFSDRTALFTFR